MCVCVCVRVCVCVHIVCLNVVCVCVCVCALMHAYLHMNIHARVCTGQCNNACPCLMCFSDSCDELHNQAEAVLPGLHPGRVRQTTF